jgi:hypothetical protein
MSSLSEYTEWHISTASNIEMTIDNAFGEGYRVVVPSERMRMH